MEVVLRVIPEETTGGLFGGREGKGLLKAEEEEYILVVPAEVVTTDVEAADEDAAGEIAGDTAGDAVAELEACAEDTELELSGRELELCTGDAAAELEACTGEIVAELEPCAGDEAAELEPCARDTELELCAKDGAILWPCDVAVVL